MTDLKVPPHNSDAERAVLGAIMLQKDAFDQAIEIVEADSFYHDNHRLIFEAILELKAKGRTVDVLSVIDTLKSRNLFEQAGGAFEVTRCTDAVVGTAHLQSHCRIMAEKAILRAAIQLGQSLTSAGYDEQNDPFEVIEQAEKQIFEITNKLSKGDVVRVDSVLVKTMQRIAELRNREEYITGVPTGYPALDRITSGWQETDLVILAARPACGKTAFSLNLLRNAARFWVNKDGKVTHPFPVGLFNLEMSAMQVTNRILSNESETPLGAIANARLDDQGMERLFTRGVQKIAGMDIYLDETPSLNIYEFKAKARRMVSKYGVRLIVLDYLQLMKPAGQKQSREQEIANISRELKITAKELRVPIIALSQMSRDVERRGGTPQLSDLRESGAIEQDADMVLFLYGRTEAECLQDASLRDDIFLKIAKHRNGELDTLLYQFERQYQRFNEKGYASTAATKAAEAAPF